MKGFRGYLCDFQIQHYWYRGVLNCIESRFWNLTSLVVSTATWLLQSYQQCYNSNLPHYRAGWACLRLIQLTAWNGEFLFLYNNLPTFRLEALVVLKAKRQQVVVKFSCQRRETHHFMSTEKPLPSQLTAYSVLSEVYIVTIIITLSTLFVTSSFWNAISALLQ